jgi:sugar/nucleoside kinase (ribokinase family)
MKQYSIILLMDNKFTKQTPRYILAGELTRDFVILPDGRAVLDVPGGNLIYAAAGLAVWDMSPPPGLVARVGEDYKQEWLDSFVKHGFDIRGVKVLPQSVDLRSFYAYTDQMTRTNDDLVSNFARIGQKFPRSLLGYQQKDNKSDSRTKLKLTALRQNDLIPEYLEATAAHICSMDFLSHSLLPAVLRQAGFTVVTLSPSSGYMNANFRQEVPSLVNGLTAFLPSEEQVRALFHGYGKDLWEMAADLASYGCELIVIKCGKRGQLLFDQATGSRWEVPPYPIKVVDPTGVGDAFCGGFLAGYRKTFDPLEAVLYGNISASLVIEGQGPFYALEALPGLAEARLDALRQSVRKV